MRPRNLERGFNVSFLYLRLLHWTPPAHRKFPPNHLPRADSEPVPDAESYRARLFWQTPCDCGGPRRRFFVPHFALATDRLNPKAGAHAQSYSVLREFQLDH